MADEPIWHLHTQDGPQGPYTATQLKQWLAAGQITKEWHVWQEGFAEWKPISEMPELSGPAGSPPPPPPRPGPAPPPPASVVAKPAASQPAPEPTPVAPTPAEALTGKAAAKPSSGKQSMAKRAGKIAAIILVIAGISAGATKYFAPEIFDALIGTPPPPPVVAAPRPPAPAPDPPLDDSMVPEDLKAENVVIVIIDGPRLSETWGDTEHKYIPHIANDMAPHGVIFSNFRNEGITKTVPGHVAIWTGHYEKIGNNEDVKPAHPGIGHIIMKEKNIAADSVWIIASKDKIAVLATNTDTKWKSATGAKTHTGVNGSGKGYGEDSATVQKAIEILKRDHPRFALIQFKEPDFSGHAKDWKGYLAGLKASDEFAWKVWQFLQTDTHYAGKTAYFLTNDHGRHLNDVKDSFAEHGDDCEGCRSIMLFASGPDFQTNVIVEEKWEQIDLAVTVARLFGVRLPGSPGKIIADLFAAAMDAIDGADEEDTSAAKAATDTGAKPK